MSTENTKKLKLYKSLTILFLITSITVITLLIINAFKNKEHQQEGSVSIEAHNQLTENFGIAQEILKLDQQLLANENRQNILEKLESFQSTIDDNYLSDIVKNRIAFTKNLIKAQSEDEYLQQDLQTELQEKNMVIDSLSKVGDSLNRTLITFKKTTERKTDSLIATAKKREMQLSRKETVKVITFKNGSGNLIHYLGETEGDKAKGNGVGIWNTGSIYRGEWLNNKRHGKGEFTWNDGQKYSGDFVDDVRTGNGIYYWPSGERYEGEFLNNKRHGNGIFYDPDGNVKFNGEWKNDKFSTS
jgi:hypothetical protein